MNSDKNSFMLKSTNSEFAQRQKNIFDQLKVLENSRNTTPNDADQMQMKEPIINNRRNQRSITKHFRGKESIFKKPQNPVPKNYINHIPDFKKHPHRWTKYSLDDVKDEDISEKGNAKAAFSFLKTLKEQKNCDMEHDGEIPQDLSKKVIFKKHIPVINKASDTFDELKPSFKSSKLIMPEYVVGQKAKKERRNRAIKEANTKELKLDHLLDFDDEVE